MTVACARSRRPGHGSPHTTAALSSATAWPSFARARCLERVAVRARAARRPIRAQATAEKASEPDRTEGNRTLLPSGVVDLPRARHACVWARGYRGVELEGDQTGGDASRATRCRVA